MNLPEKNLERKLGLFSVVNIVIANIVGAGIFTTTGYLMNYIGNPIVMLVLWVVGGLIALCGALAFGELGAAFPEAGGEYIFISKLFHPLPGFLSGWQSLLVGFSAPIAASAIGFSHYFIWAFPSVQGWLHLDHILSPGMFNKLLAIFLIVIFTLIHSRGIVFGAKVQNGLTLLKVTLIVGLVVAGFVFGNGSFEHLSATQPFRFDFDGWKSIGLALMFIMFAYSGWNSSTYIGSEIRNPLKTIPLSLIIATSVVIVLFFLLNLFFVYTVPPEKMIGEPEIAGVAAGTAFGSAAESIVSLFISFALFSSLSAFVILGPRVYYSMAREGYFFKVFAKVHPQFKVPVWSVVLQSLIAIVLVLSGTFEQILVYMGFSLGIFPVIAVLGIFKLRKEKRSVVKMPGYPFVQIIFIATGVLMLVFAFLERPAESTVAILTALSGIPFYYWFRYLKKR